MNVIGDLAGNFLTLQALLAKMPQGELISLGDPVDRGPRSREVVEFLMANGRTVHSNHAHMMVEEWKQQSMPGSHPRYYYEGLWPDRNGGMTTMKSYGYDANKLDGALSQAVIALIPPEHISFLENCPMFIETDKFIMTHAPIYVNKSAEEASRIGDGFAKMHFDQVAEQSVLWNRQAPHKVNPKLNGKINLFGHNADNKVKVYTEEFPHGIKISTTGELQALMETHDESKVYAICLDTSHGGILTGLSLKTMELFSTPIID